MLTHLHITNYTIVDTLEMEFEQGMTVITGETGAGKSIMLDGLGLCLGDRADPAAVRAGCERAEITVTFDISRIDSARRWLLSRELAADDECILRRVITREGRSRAFINGNSCTLQDCSELVALQIEIHSQHAHQSLLRREVLRHLLDDNACQGETASLLEQQASQWLRQRRELDELNAARDEQGARAQLLSYQVGELDSLDLKDGELGAMEIEQKQLANAEQVMQATQEALNLCEAQEDGARAALQLLQHDALSGQTINDARELLDSAAIQLEEARSSLRQHLDGVEINPGKLTEVESRLDAIYDIARKHKVQAPELAALHQTLRRELDGLTGSDARLEVLNSELEALLADYTKTATKLSKARTKAAASLHKKVGVQLSELAMEQCQLSVALTPRDNDNPHPQGLEDVEFLISTNPGQEPRPLGKIASGGELSRISLAIQVISADANTVPSMVFDEVDVGIGGAVAEVVGKLLRSMASASQVLCVTHLPQVAAQGHQHLQVAKSADREQARAQLTQLKKKQRVEEIARMLGGIDITDKTRAAAREMLTTAE
jgi:DNA repair protein RecN (Recombination protein N)